MANALELAYDYEASVNYDRQNISMLYSHNQIWNALEENMINKYEPEKMDN